MIAIGFWAKRVTTRVSWPRAKSLFLLPPKPSLCVWHAKSVELGGFDPDVPPADRARNRSLFFDDLLDAKVREFNPRYAEAEGALLGQFRHLHTDFYGNREFVEHLRNRGKFFDHEEKRERDLILIDYDDPSRNVYEVTEEWAFHNGHYGTRQIFGDIRSNSRGGLRRRVNAATLTLSAPVAEG